MNALQQQKIWLDPKATGKGVTWQRLAIFGILFQREGQHEMPAGYSDIRNLAHLTTCLSYELLGPDVLPTDRKYQIYKPRRGGGGGGGGCTQAQRVAAPSLRISRKKGYLFKNSACPRFRKRRVLFCTQVRSVGDKIPLQSTKYTGLWRRVTPEVTGLPSLLPLN